MTNAASRFVIAVVLLLASIASSAQVISLPLVPEDTNRPSWADEVATSHLFSVFVTLTLLDHITTTQGNLDGVKAMSKASDGEARLLAAYGKRVAKENAEFQRAEALKLCARRDELVTVESAAVAMMKYEADNMANQEQLAGRAASDLGKPLYSKLEASVGGSGISRTHMRTDWKKWMFANGKDPGAMMSSFCALF